jgi:hypothetical protein
MGAWTDAIQSQVESQTLGRASVRVITVTLTPTQLLSLAASPVQVLPSPGPNKSYIVHNSRCNYRFVTTAYGIAGMTGIRLSGNSFANAYWNVTASALLALTVNTYNAQGQFISVNVTPANLENLPMLLTANVSPTLGDALLTSTIYYSIVDGSTFQ